MTYMTPGYCRLCAKQSRETFCSRGCRAAWKYVTATPDDLCAFCEEPMALHTFTEAKSCVGDIEADR